MVSMKIGQQVFSFNSEKLPQDGQRMVSFMEDRIAESLFDNAKTAYLNLIADKKVRNCFFEAFFNAIIQADSPVNRIYTCTGFHFSHNLAVVNAITKYENSSKHKNEINKWLREYL